MNNSLDKTTQAFIQIVGRNMLLNELLLSFLEKETDLPGTCVPRLSATVSGDEHDQEWIQLLIMDCKDIDMERLWTEIALRKRANPPQCYFILYNVEPEMRIEKAAMAYGIRGIFYINDSLQMIPKGILSILKGDLWYSREILSQCLLDPMLSAGSSANSVAAGLTLREREIIAHIASGFTNKKIASDLSISVNTVKTHTYNIFRKIKVNNRHQASRWAAENL